MDDMAAPKRDTIMRPLRPLVAACIIGHKPLLLHVSRWDMDQTKESK